MSAPSVYAAISAISGELASNGIPKARTNQSDDYKYRSIDDVLDRLAPLLAKHRLCVLPRVNERIVTDRADERAGLLLHVALRVSFTLTSVDDGTSHVVEAYGEALDPGDKATAKAMSAAYKSAMIQTFCIPLGGSEDSDSISHKLVSRSHRSEPLQGWTQWCLDIEDMVRLCESEQAISTVQERYRDLLKALSREKPDLYSQLGQAFVGRREGLKNSVPAPKQNKRRSPTRTRTNASALAAVEHA